MSTIYVVMCRNDGEPEIAFTSRIDALNYVEEWFGNGDSIYRMQVVEVELKDDY